MKKVFLRLSLVALVAIATGALITSCGGGEEPAKKDAAKTETKCEAGKDAEAKCEGDKKCEGAEKKCEAADKKCEAAEKKCEGADKKCEGAKCEGAKK